MSVIRYPVHRKNRFNSLKGNRKENCEMHDLCLNDLLHMKLHD